MGPTLRELCPKPGTGAAFAALTSTDPGVDISQGVRWYAVSVKHQHERQAEKLLRLQGWDTLLPVYRTTRQWSDRMKEVELPLFSGYLFCRFPLRDRIRIEDTPGIGQVVKFLGQAAPLQAIEVDAIRAMVTSGVRLSPWPYLRAGDRVRVERGPLRGLEGTLLRDSGESRLVVSVELLQRSVAAEVDPSVVTPLRVLARGA